MSIWGGPKRRINGVIGFLLLIGILGVFYSLLLIFIPLKIINIENFLSQKLSSSKDIHTENHNVDSFINIEHFFFNHHIITGISLFLFSCLLLYLLESVPEFSIKIANDYLTPFGIIFIKTMFYLFKKV